MNRYSIILRPGILAAAMLVLTAVSSGAAAEDLKFKLGGDMEVPPVSTMASGSGAITIKPDMTVSGSLTTSGMAGTMAHIHLGKAGANGPVVIGLTRSGDNAWSVPDGAKLSEAQYQAYMDGGLYVNVHSAEHKPGEIRGQLMPPMSGKM